MKYQFDCVFHYVTDIERAISFYTDVLGLKLVSRDVVARFDIDGVLFELVPKASDKNLSGGGNARLCLRVDNIEQAVEDLAAKGIRTGPTKEVENGRLASFEDPDGNEIYLWEYR